MGIRSFVFATSVPANFGRYYRVIYGDYYKLDQENDKIL